MSYPSYATSTTGYPVPSNGVNVPVVVTLSGTGISQLVSRNTDSSNDTTVTKAGDTSSVVHEKLDGQLTALANAGVQYVAPLATNGTLQLTAGLKDAQGNVVSSVNSFTYSSFNGLKNFTNYNPLIEIVATPSETWHDNVASVSASGLITANNVGYAIIKVTYPLAAAVTEIDGTTNSRNEIAAFLLLTVSSAGLDVE